MKAQLLYDLRDATGFCSGTDLQDWLGERYGDSCLSGEVEIKPWEAFNFVAECVVSIQRNNTHLDEWGAGVIAAVVRALATKN